MKIIQILSSPYEDPENKGQMRNEILALTDTGDIFCGRSDSEKFEWQFKLPQIPKKLRKEE